MPAVSCGYASTTPPPACGDQVDRTSDGDRGHPFAPVVLVHEDAGDAVVGRGVGRRLVLLAVLDVRELLRAGRTGPRHRLVTVEHERRVCAALLDQPLLEGVVALRGERLLGVQGVEPGAPAAAEHTVVPLDEALNASQVVGSSGLTTSSGAGSAWLTCAQPNSSFRAVGRRRADLMR